MRDIFLTPLLFLPKYNVQMVGDSKGDLVCVEGKASLPEMLPEIASTGTQCVGENPVRLLEACNTC